jgi:hypothetical protein
MATACLFIGFDRPVRGREAEAYGALQRELIPQLEGFEKEGWFETFDVIGLTPHCGTLNSFILLKGDRAKLDELRRSDAFERFSLRLAGMLEGYGVVAGVTLEGLKKVLARNPDLLG